MVDYFVENKKEESGVTERSANYSALRSVTPLCLLIMGFKIRSCLFHHQCLDLLHGHFHSIGAAIKEDHITLAIFSKVLDRFCPHTKQDHIRIEIGLFHLFRRFRHTSRYFLAEERHTLAT